MKLSSFRMTNDHELPLSSVCLGVAVGASVTAAAALVVWKGKQSTQSTTTNTNEDRVVLITGCDPGGFGELLTKRALEAGYIVVAACYTQEGAKCLDEGQTTGTTRTHNANCITVVADLLTKEGRKRVVDVTKQTCELQQAGGLYAIVNNAGVAFPGNVDWLLPDYYETSMALNFHAPVELTYELLPLLKQCKGASARVINVTSVDGFITLPTNAAYNASKHALESFSDCLRIEMMPWGVKVVVIEPSTMRTPLVMSFADNYRTTFLAARPDRQAQYGDQWIHTVHEATTKGLAGAAMDPNETADDLMRALKLANPPTRIASGSAAKYVFKPLSWLPDRVRDLVLYKAIIAKQPTPQALAVPKPPIHKISHLSIRVRNLAKAIAFYKAFGFDTVGNEQSSDGQQFLKGGAHKHWKPLILLVEDPAMPPRRNSYDIGMTRLCLLSSDLDKDVEALKAKAGLEPTFPMAQDFVARIATYKDPEAL